MDQNQPPQPPQPGFLRDTIETASGWVGAGVGAALHAPLGALYGLADGVTGKFDSADSADGLPIVRWTAAGAGLGAVVAGPVGLLMGGTLAWVGSAIFLEDFSEDEADVAWLKGIDQSVQTALVDNTQGTPVKLAIQNASEGAVVGLLSGIRGGATIGKQAGQGLASAVLDVAAGVGEGVWEFFVQH